MDISIIIVNYNTAKIIAGCIDSVLHQKNIKFEIIVVDNASTDDSIAVLEPYQDQAKIKLIKNPENIGFGRANNLGFGHAQGQFIFLLNPDAQLQHSTDLHELFNYLTQNTEYGLIGPRVIKNQQDTKPNFYYPGQKHLPHSFNNLPGKIAWVIGACMLIRREVYSAVGGFDKDYFLYGEEADLCLRIRKLGWQIGHHDKITVHHLGGASEKHTPTPDLWHKKQNGLHLFYRKNYSPTDAKKLVTQELYTAKLRLILLQIQKLFRYSNKTKTRLAIKLARYQVIHNTSKMFLSNTY